MTLYWEFKYFFSCTSHCHPHDASRLLCQPEYAASAIHSEVVQPFVRDPIHGKAPGASCTRPGLLHSPVGTWIPLSVRSASITASRGGGSMDLAKNCPIPPSLSSLMLKAISWSGVRNISGVMWVWSLQWEQSLISLDTGFDHHEGSFHQQKPLHSKVNSVSKPTHQRSLCSWNLGSSITKFCTSSFSLGVNLRWECRGNILTSPLPAVGSSTNWSQRACRHLSFIILSYY